VLTEPAMSAAHDRTLQESLVNTPQAGVKIAATRELLKKMAQSPEGARLVAALIKRAQTGVMAQPTGMPGGAPAAMQAPVQAGPAPMQPGMPPEMGQQAGAMPAGMPGGQPGGMNVTAEELAAAQQLLAGPQGGPQMGGMPQGAAGVPAPGQGPATA
jgi:hypothetical protein